MNGDFANGQKHMAQLILKMLKNRELNEEPGIAENKLQNLIDNLNAQPDERPVVGFVRLHWGVPDFERQPCFGAQPDDVMKDFAGKGNKTPQGYEYTAIPVYA